MYVGIEFFIGILVGCFLYFWLKRKKKHESKEEEMFREIEQMRKIIRRYGYAPYGKTSGDSKKNNGSR